MLLVFVRREAAAKRIVDDKAREKSASARYEEPSLLTVLRKSSGNPNLRQEDIDRVLKTAASASLEEARRLLAQTQDPAKIKEGKRLLRLAAAAGNTDALVEFGKMAENGTGGDSPNLAEAYSAFLKAAELGSVYAQRKVGEMLEAGLGAPMDARAAQSWYEKAAASGDPIALERLGNLYASGISGTKDLARALDLYRQSAAAGNKNALAAIGMATIHGWGTPTDVAAGISLLSSAASQGSARSAFALYELYSSTQLGNPDIDKAATWLQRAAELNDPKSQRLLGEMLLKNSSDKATVQEAVDWLTEAAAAGDTPALLALAATLAKTETSADSAKRATQLLKQAVAQGNTDAVWALVRGSSDGADKYIQKILSDSASSGDWRAQYLQSLLQKNIPFSDAVKKVEGSTPADYIAAQIDANQTDSPNKMPRPVSMSRPQLPPAIVVQNFSGSVQVEFTVRPDGTVDRISVPGHINDVIANAVTTAAASWKFEPGQKNGKAVSTRVKMSVNFKAR